MIRKATTAPDTASAPDTQTAPATAPDTDTATATAPATAPATATANKERKMASILNAAHVAKESLNLSVNGAETTASAFAEMHDELIALAERQRNRMTEIERLMIEADADEKNTISKIADMNVSVFGGGK